MATTGLELQERRTDAPGSWERWARRLPPPIGRVLAHREVSLVLLTLAVAAALQLLWRFLLADNGGDLAAQDFWAEAAHTYPGNAYNFAWYGGMHVASYSVGSPYLMAILGVRATLMLANIAVAALSALVLARSGIRHAWVPSLLVAVAVLGNAISGRATFALGMAFAVAAVGAVFSWPHSWRTPDWRNRLTRGAVAGALSAMATVGSPVAGFFLGLLAAGMWLTADEVPSGTTLRERVQIMAHHLLARRRMAAYALGVPAIGVVLASHLLFPFSGTQPMGWTSTILPCLMALVAWLVAPLSWRTVRATSLVYVVAVIAMWVIPTQVGSNVTRLGLLFGAVTFVAALCSGEARNPLVHLPRPFPRLPATLFVTLAIITSLSWQTAMAVKDAVNSRPDKAWTDDKESIVAALEAHHANLGRVEVVPSESHIEASTMAPYFVLARGWNRQADLERNPLFYNHSTPLTANAYREWLDRWAVSFVVVPPGEPDGGAVGEAALIAKGLPYLTLVWSDTNWKLYAVSHPTPLVGAPGHLLEVDEAHMRIHVDKPGRVRIRMLYSPWLGLLDDEGNLIPAPKVRQDGRHIDNQLGCVEPDVEPVPGANAQSDKTGNESTDTWTILRAPRAGDYTLGAPYGPTQGTPCPKPQPSDSQP